MLRSGFGKASPFGWVAVYYFGFFFVYSYFSPFWGAWLSSRGMNSEQIGLILGGSLAIRCLTNLFAATYLKNLTHLLNVLRTLTLGMLVSSVLLLFCGDNLWLLALMTMVFSAFVAPIIPLSDVLTIRYAVDKQLDYGKSRQWGSIGFLIGTAISGYIIDGFGSDSILWMMIGGSVAVVLCSLRTPTPGFTITQTADSAKQWSLRQLLADREVLWLILVTCIIQGSHAGFYSFSVLYWQKQGIEPSVIGYLWAMGVIAEIVMFNFAGALIRRFPVKMLFFIASAGAVLRWGMMASTTDVLWLFLAQMLHAVTFAVGHVGVTTYIQEKPQEMSVPLQALYNAIPASAAIALATAVTGFFFDDMQGDIFWGMSLMGVVGMMVSLRQPKGQKQQTEVVA